MRTQYAASIEFAGRKMQVTYRTPRELVRALRDMGRSTTANMRVLRLYAKGDGPRGMNPGGLFNSGD